MSLFDLTSFQRDLLYVIDGCNQASGQEIKEKLESDVGDITHGRLYPNLDTLVEGGYVEKGSLDRRTNYYKTSEMAKEKLRQRREWENQYVKERVVAD